MCTIPTPSSAAVFPRCSSSWAGCNPLRMRCSAVSSWSSATRGDFRLVVVLGGARRCGHCGFLEFLSLNPNAPSHGDRGGGAPVQRGAQAPPLP